MSDTYTCAVCEGVFAKAWSDEDAIAETRSMYGDEIADNVEETCDVLCDDCHQEYLAWMKRRGGHA
jgi:hypothetical protein